MIWVVDFTRCCYVDFRVVVVTLLLLVVVVTILRLRCYVVVVVVTLITGWLAHTYVVTFGCLLLRCYGYAFYVYALFFGFGYTFGCG